MSNAVDVVDKKYFYLPFKRDIRKQGKCEEMGCFAYHPDDPIWCRSTEPPVEKCPKFKRKASKSDKPKKHIEPLPNQLPFDFVEA